MEMAALLQRELLVLTFAYLLAGIPVGGIVLAGRMSPVYRVPSNLVCRWWSWGALGVVVCAWLSAIVGA
jgi:hypothetical protein